VANICAASITHMTEGNAQLEAIKILINGIHIAHSKNCFNLFEAEVLAQAVRKFMVSPEPPPSETQPATAPKGRSQPDTTWDVSRLKIDITDV
jgi:hypothetical protein